MEPGLNMATHCKECNDVDIVPAGYGEFNLANLISEHKCKCGEFINIKKIHFKKCTYEYDMISGKNERVSSPKIVSVEDGIFETEKPLLKLAFKVERLPSSVTRRVDNDSQRGLNPIPKKVEEEEGEEEDEIPQISALNPIPKTFEEEDDDEDEIPQIKENPQMSVMKYEIPDYEIKLVKMLGRGSYGRVYSAKWMGSGGGDDIAVKVIEIMIGLEKEAREAAMREFQIILDMNHRRIVRVFGFSIPPGKGEIRILMELMDGDVGRFVREKKDMTLYEKFELMHKMTQALNFLHSKGCIHRDVKSFNFLHRNNGKEIVIADFGLSRTLQNSKTHHLSGFKGTIRWMAPELMVVNPKYNTASDVYGLGMTYWEVLFEDVPFKSQVNDFALIGIIRDQTPIPKMSDPDFPVPLKGLILTCLNKKHKVRPTTEELLKWFDDHRELFKNKYDVVMKFKRD